MVERFLGDQQASRNRYAALLVPQKLAEELRGAAVSDRVCRGKPSSFFLGTYEEWLDQQFPELGTRRLGAEEELQLLRVLLPAGCDPTLEDLVFYQAVVLNPDLPEWAGLKSVVNWTKDLTGRGSGALSAVRKKLLEGTVPAKRFLERLREYRRSGDRRGKGAFLSRAQVPGEVLKQIWSKNHGRDIESTDILLIVDEAQERLITEILALKELVDRWLRGGRTVRLVLLGDLN
jgi:hypothetical protein